MLITIGENTKIIKEHIQQKDNCRLIVGNNCLVESIISFDRENASVTIGDRSFIGFSNILCSREITIGDDVLIAWGCTIVDHNSHSIYWDERKNDVIDWAQGRKDLIRIALLGFSLFFFTLSIGCSNEKEQEKSPNKGSASLYEKVLRENQLNTERAKSDRSIKDEKVRNKYLAIAENCDKNYTSCIEKCTSSECENSCLKSLETCEKSLPTELRTLK